jgi:hypothetical protein
VTPTNSAEPFNGGAQGWSYEALRAFPDPFGTRIDRTFRAPFQAVAIADTNPPVVGNFTPSPGSTINPTTMLGFDVTDNAGLRRVILGVYFPGFGFQEIVHDGTSFMPNYAAASTRVAITNGYRYTVQRAGGWPPAVASLTLTFNVWAIDTSGNEA